MNIDVIRWGRFFIPVILVCLTLSALVFGVSPFRYHAELRNGMALDIQIPDIITQKDATQLIAGSGVMPSTVVIRGSDQNKITAHFGSVLANGQIEKIESMLRNKYLFGVAYADRALDPSVLRSIMLSSIMMIGATLMGALFLILVRFDWTYAMVTAVVLIGTVSFVVALFLITKCEIDTMCLAAALTVITYILNESIVIMDRLRENMRLQKVIGITGYSTLMNETLCQVFKRSLLVFLIMVAGMCSVLFFGVTVLQTFAYTVLVGVTMSLGMSYLVAPRVWMWLTME